MRRIAIHPLMKYDWLFRRLRKISKSDYYLRHISVCPSFRMEQKGSRWKDFHEIWYLSIVRTSIGKSLIKTRQKRPIYVNENISLISS
jgi:hypothetical protein